MFTPFEELEYLAEYLPEEGESVLISRKDGELVCQPWRTEGLRDGIEEAPLYGLLVQANERLNARANLPLWATGLGLFWLLVTLFTVGGFGWNSWFLVPGLGLFALWGCFLWIRQRQRTTFQHELRPRIDHAMRQRGIDPHALTAGMRQHAELRTLLDEFVQFTPAERRERE